MSSLIALEGNKFKIPRGLVKTTMTHAKPKRITRARRRVRILRNGDVIRIPRSLVSASRSSTDTLTLMDAFFQAWRATMNCETGITQGSLGVQSFPAEFRLKQWQKCKRLLDRWSKAQALPAWVSMAWKDSLRQARLDDHKELQKT